jgi:hypothetical protein
LGGQPWSPAAVVANAQNMGGMQMFMTAMLLSRVCGF